MMRNIFLLPFLLAAFVVTTLALPPAGEKLQIGEAAPKATLKMTDISGKEVSLEDVKKENGLLVMFSCNTCPWVIAWENRYDEIAAACEKNGIGFILVNSNEAQRDGDDSMEAMKEHAKDNMYNYLYVVDQNHVLADAFGADRTPEAFLFDKKMMLKYTGAIDNNAKDQDAVTKHYLMNAIKSVANGERVKEPVTKSLGCSIKRVS